MNMLDMYTREKANKAHLDELHDEAKAHQLLRNANGDGKTENARAKRRLRLTLAFATLVILLGAFLAIVAIGI